MPNIGFLNGQFLPLDELRVSGEDRGYQFGDGVYEVIRVYHGTPFSLPDHLTRLEQSAAAICLPLPLTLSELEDKILQGIQSSGYASGKVYIQITRGVAPRSHPFPEPIIPTVVMTFREMMPLDERDVSHGVAAITVPDLRWGRCDIKSLNLLPNVLAKQQAQEARVFEAIFIRDGQVTEGTSSNVMGVWDHVLRTPALTNQILEGVTRNQVLKLARREGIPVQEGPIVATNLPEAQELFLIGTTIEVLPVTRLNGKPIANGEPGPVSQTLLARFRELVG